MTFGQYWSAFTVAVVSPFFALLLGIAPPVIWFTPVIAIGNIVLVTVLWLIAARWSQKYTPVNMLISTLGAGAAAVAKFGTLWLGVVVMLLPLLSNLAEKQVAAFTAMFTWPQLFTALIGTVIAVLTAPLSIKP